MAASGSINPTIGLPPSVSRPQERPNSNARTVPRSSLGRGGNASRTARPACRNGYSRMGSECDHTTTTQAHHKEPIALGLCATLQYHTTQAQPGLGMTTNPPVNTSVDHDQVVQSAHGLRLKQQRRDGVLPCDRRLQVCTCVDVCTV